MILAIDTSAGSCAVALWWDEPLTSLVSEANLRHNEALIGQIDEVLKRVQASKTTIAAIAVSSGPGSFTGLRVGMAIAKALCWAWQKPLICVPTLEAWAASVPASSVRILALMPARAQEVYWQIWAQTGENLQACGDCQVSSLSDLPQLVHGNILLCGGGYERHQGELERLFAGRWEPAAGDSKSLPPVLSVGRIAQRRFASSQFDDIMSAEPAYFYPFPAKPKPFSINP